MRNLWCFLGAVLSFLFVVEARAASYIPLDTIMAADAGAGDGFAGPFEGSAISTDGSTLLVSAWQADCAAGPNCGAAYVFVRAPGGWVQQAKLTGPDSVTGDQFMDVALSGDGNIALVGAGNAACAAGSQCGAVYFFVRNGTTWSFQQKLTASDAAADDRFGSELGLSNDGTVALVGALQKDCGTFFSCGAVYAFERSGNVWTEKQKFSGDPNSSAYFGGVIALSGDGNTALIDGDVHGGVFAARAYVFTRIGGVWTFQAKLAPVSPSAFAFAFYMDVSADGNVALIHEDNFSSEDVLYMFTRTGATWSTGTPLPSSLATGNQFALSDDGQTAVVTTPNTCSGPTCPVARVIHRDQGTWTLLQPLFVSGLDFATVEISGDARVILLGDSQAPCAAGSFCGAAHLFGSLLPLEDVPTVSQLGLVLLALLLAGSGARMLARRRRSV